MTMSMTRTTLLFIRKTLEDCQRFPGFVGAVLSSPDGLVLASTGGFSGDESAACASSLNVHTTASLGLLESGAPREMLIWEEGRIWSLAVLPGEYLLLIASTQTELTGPLRALAQRTAEMLNQALRILV
jgi:predicted regulator of Ras-like GTPase activity (Roadblock/LC7/MglB family)